MTERPKVHAWKACRGFTLPHGFESHPLRQLQFQNFAESAFTVGLLPLVSQTSNRYNHFRQSNPGKPDRAVGGLRTPPGPEGSNGSTSSQALAGTRRAGFVFHKMSSYIVLARKLRPQTFDEVVGQDYIVKALCNAARSGKLAHALLLTGPRGVGKTSTARIVAKTVNCEKPSEKRPCSKDSCESCSLISDGRAVEVQEMDAASHTSVNDVRDIIEKSRYLPASGKTKVYIIDEAHMLSQAAFNALLKTLEEPPAHVLFILATTEPHKIPATILSRCQRYDFRKVSVTEISSSLKDAAQNENIKIASETISTIALEADGSMRDALSLLDQLIATFGNNIDHTEALSLLGFADTNLMNEMFEAIMEKNPAKGIETLVKILDKGISPAKFAEGITSLVRTALILKVSGENSVPDISNERAALLLESAKDRSAQTLEMLFDMAMEMCDRVSRSFYQEMTVDAMVIRLCSADKPVPLDDIMRKLNKLTGEETPYSNPAGTDKKARMQETPKRNATEKMEKTEEKSAVQTTRENGTDKERDSSAKGKENAGSFADFLKSGEEEFGFIANMVAKCEIRIENSVAVIKVPKPSVMHTRFLKNKKDERESFLRKAEKFFECGAKIEFFDTGEEGNGIEKIQDKPLVKQALEMFDGKITTLGKGGQNEI